MLGFNQFRHAALSSAEIELMQRIRKGSSGCDVSAFEVELRPQCGMQCSGHGTMRQGRACSCCHFAQNRRSHR